MKQKRERKKKTPDAIHFPQNNSSANNRLSIWLPAVAVATITFTVYIPALKNGFVNWDDHLYVYENPNIQTFNLDFINWAFTAIVAALWHPLTLISLATDYAIWGLNPKGYHLTNIILHSINTLLVFLLVIELIKCSKSLVNSKKTITIALLTSLLFGIHPIHVESVAWISERKDVLSALFYISTLLAYIKYISEKSSNKWLYILSIVFFTLAIMSKPMAVSLPVVLLVLDYYPLKRFAAAPFSIKRLIYEKLPFLILSAFSASITLWAHKSKMVLQPLEIIPVTYRLISAINGFIFYLIKMIIPYNLAPLYMYPDQITFPIFESMLSIALFVLITFFAIRNFKKHPVFSASWLYYIITLLPVIGIVQVGIQSSADRYAYLPSISPFLLITVLSVTIFDKCRQGMQRTGITAAGIILLFILTFLTIRQIDIWQDSLTLWSHEIKLFPKVPLAYNNRGEYLYSMNKNREAFLDFTKAIELKPDYAMAYNNRAGVFFSIADYQQAVADYSKAIELNPQYPDAYFNRGVVAKRLGNFQQALWDYSKAIELKPQDAVYYNNRGNIYKEVRDYQRAINDYRKAIDINPRSEKAYFNLATIYDSIGNAEQAVLFYKTAAQYGSAKAKEYLNTRAISW